MHDSSLHNSSQPVVSSPFVASSRSVQSVMLSVIYALLPGIILYVLFYGWGVLINIVLAVVSGLFFEWVMLLLRKRPVSVFLFDGSAVLSAILLALALPPMLAWWIPVLGSFFAIVGAKHLYGGLGYNLFNPAMLAYAILLISFPLDLSVWSAPLLLIEQPLELMQAISYSLYGQLPAGISFDALSSATPLDHIRNELSRGHSLGQLHSAAMFGWVAGLHMEWVNTGFLLGGIWLIYRNIISWHIPLSVLLALVGMASIFYLIDSHRYADPALHLWAGATIMGAFFIATDPVTASTTPRGKIVYGVGIGILIYAIRAWGSYPDGVAFAVLLMGLTVPLLDHFTVPEVFGAKEKK